ncbi:MAG TPA: GYF domain-containing protein, partial [Anaeromyxobacteraceae bacterium]
MKFSCDSCGSQYMISDDKVGPTGVKVRCKKCGNVVSVKRPPVAAPELTPASGSIPASGVPEGALDRELGDAFDSAFGGTSPGAPGGAEPGAPSEPDLGQDWYVAVDDNQVGPIPAADVKSRWESGEVGPDTLAWRPGMADWVPISTIADMAQYLAPVPRGGRSAPRSAAAVSAALRAEPTPTPAPIAPAGSPSASAAPTAQANGHAGGAQTGWKPSAGSALAALASEEMASLDKPEKKAAESTVKSGSLVDKMELPDGGVDPTNLLPLPIKGLEQTSEARLEKPRVGLGAGAGTELRQIKKSAVRSVVAVGVVMLVLLGAAVAALAWYLKPHEAEPVARAPVAAPPVAP